MAKKNTKKSIKNKDVSKKEKQVVTIKVPSINLNKMNIKYVIAILGIFLAVSIFFNFRGGFTKGIGSSGGKMSLAGLAYLCPPGNCDTSQVGQWSNDIGYQVTSYEAPWAQAAIGLLFEGDSVGIIDVRTEAGFYTSVCDANSNKKACDVATEAEKQAAEQSCDTMKKQTTPKLEAFVVSYCPYGLQMQRILVPVHAALGNSADIVVRYMGEITGGKITSMHGDQEAQENLKQICIREEQPDKYWEYLSCFMEAGKSDECSTEVGIDTAKLASCTAADGKGLEYAQTDFDAQNKYAVTGSPSLFLNGEQVSEFNFGGRTSEALKTLICCGMSKEADGCSPALSTEQANTAFAEQYSSGSTTGSGSC